MAALDISVAIHSKPSAAAGQDLSSSRGPLAGEGVRCIQNACQSWPWRLGGRARLSLRQMEKNGVCDEEQKFLQLQMLEKR